MWSDSRFLSSIALRFDLVYSRQTTCTIHAMPLSFCQFCPAPPTLYFFGLFWNNYYLLLLLLLFYLWLRMYFVKWTLTQLSPQPFHPRSQCPLSCTCPNQTSHPHSIMCKETDKMHRDQFHTKDHYKVEQVCCLFLCRTLCSSCWL